MTRQDAAAAEACRSRPTCRGSTLAVAVLLAGLLACGSSRPPPEPERKPIVLDTVYHDMRAGDEQSEEVLAELGRVPDEALQAYLQRLGERLIRHAPERPFTYRFQIVDQWSPNAFALPGGAIFVSRGLLVLTNSEDELANVLAHEVAHAAERHAAGRQAYMERLTPFSLGLRRYATVASYARDQERAADDTGQRIAAASGYDPRAMTRFLKSLEKVELFELGASRLPTFLDTHPATGERIASTATRAQGLSWSASEAVLSREQYLGRVEGLVVGANPAEGVFQGQRFLHPDLDFALNFPSGWQTENTHSAVVAVSPARDARFSLEFAGRGNDPRVAAGAFLAEQAERLRATVHHAQSLHTACCAAYEIHGHVDTPQGRVSGQITWIAHGGNIYQISTSALAHVASKYLGRANAMTKSFRPLTDAERASVDVDRLGFARANPGETLAQFSERTGNAWNVQRTALANALTIHSVLEGGELLKIAVRGTYQPAPAEAGSQAPERPTAFVDEGSSPP
jgi:predicted Zn-dependent protease